MSGILTSSLSVTESLSRPVFDDVKSSGPSSPDRVLVSCKPDEAGQVRVSCGSLPEADALARRVAALVTATTGLRMARDGHNVAISGSPDALASLGLSDEETFPPGRLVYERLVPKPAEAA